MPKVENFLITSHKDGFHTYRAFLLKSIRLYTEFRFSSSSDRKQHRPTSTQRSSSGIRVGSYHHVPIFIKLVHLTMPRSWSKDIQSVAYRLGSVMNTSVRRPLWKRALPISGHSSRRLCSTFLETTSLRFFIIKYGRYGMASYTSSVRFCVVGQPIRLALRSN